MPDTSTSLISIIIPVRNDPENLDACLNALMQSSYPCFECIVVNDFSDDRKTEFVIATYAVSTMKTRSICGPAYARNKGAKMAKGDILLFLDADVRVYPETIANIAAELENGEIDAVIGSYDSKPSDHSFFSQYKNLFHHYVHQNLSLNTCTFWAGCGAIRKEVFDRLGGFDISYRRPAIEDIELGMRLSSQGGYIKLNRQILVKHLKRWTFLKMLKTDIIDRGIPWSRLLLSRGKIPNNLNVSSSQRVYVILTFVFLLSCCVLPFSNGFKIPLVLTGMIALIVLFVANLAFYRFFYEQKGVIFAVRVVPLHILYFLYCGISFGLASMSFYFNKFIFKKRSSNPTEFSKTLQKTRQREIQNV